MRVCLFFGNHDKTGRTSCDCFKKHTISGFIRQNKISALLGQLCTVIGQFNPLETHDVTSGYFLRSLVYNIPSNQSIKGIIRAYFTLYVRSSHLHASMQNKNLFVAMSSVHMSHSVMVGGGGVAQRSHFLAVVLRHLPSVGKFEWSSEKASVPCRGLGGW